MLWETGQWHLATIAVPVNVLLWNGELRCNCTGREIKLTVMHDTQALSHQISGFQTRTTTTILWPVVRDYPGEPVPEETPTHHPDHHPVFISFFHLPRSIMSSLFKLRAWQSFAQPVSMSSFSLVYFVVWSPPPHIPYISSPNQCLLFAAIAACFINIISSIPSLSLNSLLGTLSFTKLFQS